MDDETLFQYMQDWAANDLTDFVDGHDEALEQEHGESFPTSWVAVFHQAYTIMRSSGVPIEEMKKMLNNLEVNISKVETFRDENVTLH
jgi:hypothetical protein